MNSPEFEHLGEWWLPEQPERRLGGTLRFLPAQGLQLSLVGCLIDDYEDDDKDHHRIVHGQATGAGNVTLLGCWQSGMQQSDSPGSSVLVITDYRADTALIGAHFHGIEELRFQKATVSYSHLTEWMNLRSFHWDHGQGDDGERGRVDRVTYRQPEPVEMTIGPIEVSLWSQLTANHRWYGAELTQTYVVHLDANEPWTVQKWERNFINPFQDFLTFATNRPNAVTEFEVLMPELDPTRNGWPDRRCRVVHLSNYQPSSSEEKRRPPKMLFTYNDIADRFADALNAWVGLYESIDSTIHLFLGTLYHKGRFPFAEMEFLNLVQAAESYHRGSQRSGDENTPEEHEARLERIYKHFSGKDRQWLRAKLKWSNNKSLPRRIQDLLGETNLVVAPFVSDDKAFAERIAGARNFLSHFDKSLEPKQLDLLSLVDAMNTLAIMLQALLLHELGFSAEDAYRHVKATDRYREIGKQRLVGWQEDE